MSLVAIALNIEVAFVAAHHIARVLIVMLAADPVFSLLSKRGGGPPQAGGSGAPGPAHGAARVSGANEPPPASDRSSGATPPSVGP
jgi:hypothetical protein